MVNINGLPKINGENYPLDIWSLYMQNAASMFPEQEFDVPSPYMDLEIKTDGRAVPPETTEDTGETTESTTGSDAEDKDEGLEDDSSFDEPAEPDPEQQRAFEPAPQFASPAPQSASPAPQSVPPAVAPPAGPQPAPGGAGPRRGAPADNAGPPGGEPGGPGGGNF
jgi:penicillin-binding protein 1A